MGWADHIEQQHSDVTKHSNRVTEPVYQVEPLRAFCEGTGSVGKRELRDRNEDCLPEWRIAWDTERAAERLSRSQRCGCAAERLCRHRQKDSGSAHDAGRVSAPRSVAADLSRVSSVNPNLPSRRIKSDTPLRRFTTLTPTPY